MLADRAQLVGAAERVIRAQGLDITMDDVAREANVSKPIVYRTVGDKGALVEALSEALVERIASSTERAGIASGDPRTDFLLSVRSYLAAVHADRNLFLFVNASEHQPAQLRQRIDRSASQLIEMFARAHGAPRESSVSADRTWGYAIVGALQVVTTMWLHDDYCDLDELAEDVTRLLWPGVRAALDA